MKYVSRILFLIKWETVLQAQVICCLEVWGKSEICSRGVVQSIWCTWSDLSSLLWYFCIGWCHSRLRVDSKIRTCKSISKFDVRMISVMVSIIISTMIFKMIFRRNCKIVVKMVSPPHLCYHKSPHFSQLNERTYNVFGLKVELKHLIYVFVLSRLIKIRNFTQNMLF